MTRLRLLVLVSCIALGAAPAQAGIIFGKKKPKPEPGQRVPELLGIVKTSPDESKRADAADELRKYDPATFPEMIPALIDVMQNDAKPGVRLSALTTVVKFRPVSQDVGTALEQVLAKDASMRVRLQARSSLLQYHIAGYRSPKGDPKTPTGKEPPLAPPLPPPSPLPPLPAPTTTGTKINIRPQPLAMPPAINTHAVPLPAPVKPTTSTPQRMPIGPTQIKTDGPDL